MNEQAPKPLRHKEFRVSEQSSTPPKNLEASSKLLHALEQQDEKTIREGTNTLVGEVSKDFAQHHAPLTPQETSSLGQKVKDAAASAGKRVSETVFSPDMQKDMAEYKNIVSDIEKTYKFSSIAPEFYEAADKIRTNTVLETLSIYGIQHATNPGHIEKAVAEVVGFSAAKGNWDRLKRAMTIAKETLPYVYVLGLIPPLVNGRKISKQFEESTMKLRSAINTRVAQSVFMRDFEFIHDKPASEIMNIVDKGKQATVDLMRITYKGMLPKIAALGAITTTEFLIAPPAGILGLIRIPFLARHGEQTARKILKARAENLKRKDLIDARVMSSLQSLEVVRTTDSMVNAMEELQSNMSKSDEVDVAADSSRSDRDKKEAYYGLGYTYGIPIVAAGWEALMNWDALTNKNPKADRLSNPSLNVMLAGTSTMALEGINGAMIEEMVHDYTDKIQPALQDIRRMNELLGPYDQVDTPEGPREQSRVPVESLSNFDISIRNLRFKNILHNVSMDIPQGSFVTIKGQSGIGKTTFLRHMLGLFGAEEGNVSYGGHDLNSIKKYGEHSIYSQLAYANQNPQYFENMTLRENLLLWTKKQVDTDKVTQVLHDLHLDHIADRMDSNVKHFSGGELRRIGIARALLKDPKVLFLDEPTANLDEASAKQVLDIVKQMRKTRPDMTVVAVTHDPSFEGIAEKIIDFAEVNKPTDMKAESLGNRQVFYASSASPSKK